MYLKLSNQVVSMQKRSAAAGLLVKIKTQVAQHIARVLVA